MRYSPRVHSRQSSHRAVDVPLPESGELRRLAAEYGRVWPVFARMSDRALNERRNRLDRMMKELGVHFSLFEEQGPFDAGARVDPVPRILPPAEWAHISAGVAQRARMLDAFVRDAYGERGVVRAGVLAPETLLGSSGFHFELAGLPFSWGAVALAALDLVRTHDGQWLVWDQQVSNPLGLAHVLHNRRMLSRALPELFEVFPIEPVSSFPLSFAERLREIGERVSGRKSPFIVLLTRTETNRSYFEESFLGRQMGIPMVRPADLVIRDGAVFLRTVEGQRKVDVIFRRIPAHSMDPVTFPYSSHNGIPGVVHCLRQGEVTVVNGLGAELGDDRVLLRHSERLTGFYLGERPILASVETLDLSERDQLVEALSDRERYAFAARLPSGDPIKLHEGYADADDGFTEFVRVNARDIIARRRVSVESTSWRENGRFVEAPQRLRVFCLLGPEPLVLPGGLTESLPGADIRTGGVRLKDTWVPVGSSREVVALVDPDPVPRELPLGSRVANSMYWIGRYIERAENTSRMLSTLESIPVAADEQHEGDDAWLLWHAVAATAGGSKLAGRTNPVPRDPLRLATALLLDGSDPNSVGQSLHQATFLAGSIREFLTPEFWSALSSLRRVIDGQAGRRRLSPGQYADLCGALVAGVARAFGTARRTLLHDAGWHFFSIGALLERVITTVNILERVLVQAVARQQRYPFGDAGLTSLLLLTGSLDAYHRVFRSRAYVDRVARLLWQSEVAPNAVLYCLLAIRSDLGDLGRFGDVPWREPAQRVDHLAGEVRKLPINTFFPAQDGSSGGLAAVDRASVARITAASRMIRESIEGLHDLLGDSFFSHQALPAMGRGSKDEAGHAL